MFQYNVSQQFFQAQKGGNNERAAKENQMYVDRIILAEGIFDYYQKALKAGEVHQMTTPDFMIHQCSDLGISLNVKKINARLKAVKETLTTRKFRITTGKYAGGYFFFAVNVYIDGVLLSRNLYQAGFIGDKAVLVSENITNCRPGFTPFLTSIIDENETFHNISLNLLEKYQNGIVKSDQSMLEETFSKDFQFHTCNRQIFYKERFLNTIIPQKESSAIKIETTGIKARNDGFSVIVDLSGTYYDFTMTLLEDKGVYQISREKLRYCPGFSDDPEKTAEAEKIAEEIDEKYHTHECNLDLEEIFSEYYTVIQCDGHHELFSRKEFIENMLKNEPFRSRHEIYEVREDLDNGKINYDGIGLRVYNLIKQHSKYVLHSEEWHNCNAFKNDTKVEIIEKVWKLIKKLKKLELSERFTTIDCDGETHNFDWFLENIFTREGMQNFESVEKARYYIRGMLFKVGRFNFNLDADGKLLTIKCIEIRNLDIMF